MRYMTTDFGLLKRFKVMENNTWKKILFLDIDGVLASVDFLCRTAGRTGFIDKEKVALLNKLKPYGVEVVISSSWGYNDDTVKRVENNIIKYSKVKEKEIISEKEAYQQILSGKFK